MHYPRGGRKGNKAHLENSQTKKKIGLGKGQRRPKPEKEAKTQHVGFSHTKHFGNLKKEKGRGKKSNVGAHKRKTKKDARSRRFAQERPRDCKRGGKSQRKDPNTKTIGVPRGGSAKRPQKGSGRMQGVPGGERETPIVTWLKGWGEPPETVEKKGGGGDCGRGGGKLPRLRPRRTRGGVHWATIASKDGGNHVKKKKQKQRWAAERGGNPASLDLKNRRETGGEREN